MRRSSSTRRGEADARISGSCTGALYVPRLPACKTVRGALFSPAPKYETFSARPNGQSHVKIRKAVITAAGRTQRNLPLQTLVDRDGHSKSALTILIEEVLHAENRKWPS